MIPYEELVAALDRYVARNGGTPQSVHAPAGHAAAPEFAPPPIAHYDEPHDPDLHGGHAMHGGIGGHGAEEDATHVGASPGGAPPPLQPAPEDHSNEIDIGDVLADDEL
ncbi:MAG TPA: hypothetical protein VN947_02005 [Polyangia bacterium]|nr:hypothetical protein [Polyangia bacterium]